MARQAQDAPGADHAADRLVAAVDRAGAPACVGIDPVIGRLPAPLRAVKAAASKPIETLMDFSLGLLDAIADLVPCVKIQSACFERYGHRGVQTLERVIGEATQRGFAVILDAKRGDISVTGEHYAAAAFGPRAGGGRPDWITVNSYLGADAIEPFLRPGAGVFALVRTTNPGSDAVQSQRLADGRTVAESVAKMVATLGEAHVGGCGYSAVGAVVGATRPDEISALRALMPRQVFLVPGYGSQGGGVDDIRPCFDARGRGAVVSASRSVIYAFDPDAGDWTGAVTDAAKRFADEVARATR
ncbi:MAG: orotidine-5'-phosphate decarboxylase [Planctomycetota bacterium]|jgi:orotidine-5'-phosphate decarboxylase